MRGDAFLVEHIAARKISASAEHKWNVIWQIRFLLFMSNNNINITFGNDYAVFSNLIIQVGHSNILQNFESHVAL